MNQVQRAHHLPSLCYCLCRQYSLHNFFSICAVATWRLTRYLVLVLLLLLTDTAICNTPLLLTLPFICWPFFSSLLLSCGISSHPPWHCSTKEASALVEQVTSWPSSVSPAQTQNSNSLCFLGVFCQKTKWICQKTKWNLHTATRVRLSSSPIKCKLILFVLKSSLNWRKNEDKMLM